MVAEPSSNVLVPSPSKTTEPVANDTLWTVGVTSIVTCVGPVPAAPVNRAVSIPLLRTPSNPGRPPSADHEFQSDQLPFPPAFAQTPCPE